MARKVLLVVFFVFFYWLAQIIAEDLIYAH